MRFLPQRAVVAVVMITVAAATTMGHEAPAEDPAD